MSKNVTASAGVHGSEADTDEGVRISVAAGPGNHRSLQLPLPITVSAGSVLPLITVSNPGLVRQHPVSRVQILHPIFKRSLQVSFKASYLGRHDH